MILTEAQRWTGDQLLRRACGCAWEMGWSKESKVNVILMAVVW